MRPLLFLLLTVTASLLSPFFAVDQNAGYSADLTVTNIIVDERVYFQDEVDKVAETKNLTEVLNEFQSSLTCAGEETITLSIVLRKSGKVTDVKIETAHGCKMPDSATAILHKIIFAPAIKKNVPVSQLLEIQMRLVAVPG